MKKIIVLAMLQLANFYSVAQRNKFVIPEDIFGSRVFIKNNGQYDKLAKVSNNIEFAYNNEDENVYFSTTGLTYLIKKRHKLTHEQKEALEHNEKITFKIVDSFYVNVTWENSNPNIKIVESEKQNNYFSYGDFKADCFKKITYLNVYNNIDIEYVFTSDKKEGIKYNLILHPGANINDIKIKYSGDVKGLKIKDGNVIIKTPSQNIIEHAPISFQNNSQVNTNFTLNNDVIGFSIPDGYNQNSTLVIDPWVSNLSIATNNYGYDVDYDYSGNYFVYGGSSNYKVSKYTAAGALAWTFAGTVASQGWTSGSTYAANFLCEKTTGKIYVGDCPVSSGARIVRLDVAGLYDNFISIANAQWTELWDMGYNCGTGQVYGLGGSVANPGNVSAGILNTGTGALFPQNFTGIGTFAQDVVSHAFDPSGTLFFIFASAFGTPSLNNRIMRVNATFNGNVWLQPSTYTSMSEAANKASYVGAGTSSNGFNCLAANTNFLFYYDGFNLAAYNKTTGAKVGFTTIAGNTLKRYGGIAVDACNNVYIGGNNAILSYNFNGTTFSALPSIPAGAASVNKDIYDIKLDEPTNLLYVSGSGFGGVYNAANSSTCTQVQLTITPVCVGNNNGTAVATLTTTIVNPVVSYSWTNSSNVVVSQTNNSTVLTNTATNLANGNYTLFAQINAPCGPIFSQTFVINCVCSVTAAATSSCVTSGISTSLSLGAISGFSTNPITYAWSGPSGYTTVPAVTASQTLATAANGVYTLTVVSPACTGTGTVMVTSPSTFTPSIISSSVSCYNGSNGTASVSAITGTSTAPYAYLWSNTQTAVQATSLTAGNYTCLVTDAKGCTYSATTTIIQPAQAFLTLGNTSVTCNNGNNGTASVVTIPIANTGPYTYTWSTTPIQNAAIAGSLTAGTYSCILQDNIGCIFTGTTTLIQPTSVSVTISTNTTQVCMGTPINFTGLASGGTGSAYTYSWSTGSLGANTAISEPNGGTYTYTLTAFDANMCTTTAVKTVTFIPNPVLTCVNRDICYGQSTNLYVNGASNYSWSPSTGLNTTSGSAVIASNSVTTVYTILGNNSFCTGSTNVTVAVIPYPYTTITSPNQEICFGSSTTIDANGAMAYNWTPNYAISNTTGQSVVVSPSVTTNYTITSYNFSGTVVCSETKMMPIIVVPQVTPSISNNQIICIGDKVTLQAGGGNTFKWTPSTGLNQTNLSGVVASPSVSTVYTVHVSNKEYCGHDATVSVIVNPYPTVFAGRDTTYNLDEPMFLNATGTGTMTWISGEGIFCSVCPNTKITATHSGCYIIETVNAYGCKAKDEVCIEVTLNSGVYIPNAFSPNDDGLNDIFYVYGYSISDVTMDIFDRWGEKLFSSTDQKIGWNGSHKGTPCKNDVYVYKVSYKGLDGKKQYKTGHVTINR
ncbi:MAG: gliding motility-associated C-terminal domain-containing protein [Bacteroidota bacterium]|nr:gliding motility-associated C-terminal domain-containing protein [Bacteroidota bacterium]